jgi:hypothetical protein
MHRMMAVELPVVMVDTFEMMLRENGKETYQSYCYERMRLRRSPARRRRAPSASYSDSEMGERGIYCEEVEAQVSMARCRWRESHDHHHEFVDRRDKWT